ncbi:hypothetical protein L6164_008780 [Bauhinia variegata]|uniref:Uncharacterized protein n=1 Tax=Bauhinia variegata TaxID=167791 RepID=A0ACB9PIY3_BAUVA|nr:hypothetical protein L6164_008780 [Bauhinia variegata]
MDMEGLSVICAGLGNIEEDDNGNRIDYSKGEYCLDNLKDLLRFLRRDDPQNRDVFKQVCKWNIVSKDLIPIIEYCQQDRNLLLNAVKVLVFLTMPIEPTSTDISQQLEYLWDLKFAITSSNVVAVIVSFLESPLENLERDAFTEDDWKLMQLVLTLFRNILAIQEISLQQKSGGSASQFLSLRDRFLEVLFHENVMDIILVITHYVGSSGNYLRQDNLLLLEIFHYIFMGQEPELIVRTRLNGPKVDEDSRASLNSLESIMKEEEEKRRLHRTSNMSRHSQFSGTFARLTMDGSKAVFKGNPSSASRNMLLKSKSVTRGPAKKIAWDHQKLPSTKDNILELLRGFVEQFLSGAYNVLMQSIREDIEKEHPAIQKSDVVIFFHVAEFATSFQFYKCSASKTKERVGTFVTLSDKDADSTDFSGQICGPIAASMNDSMFQLVISKWRYAFDGIKETNDYKFLSAAGSLLKNMIRMLDLVLKLLPEDSKEPQTARILLYKLFYDQTEEGITHFLLNLMKMFDTHKQPKSDLADLVEIIHKVVKLMETLQARGTLRVSRKSRKVKKKKNSEGTESVDRPFGDYSGSQNDIDMSNGNQVDEKQAPQNECPLETTCDVEEGILISDNIDEHEKQVEKDEKDQDGLAPIDNINSEHANDDMLHDMADSSGDEQLTAIHEVDFKVSTLVSAYANHQIIQKLCWLLKFYKSNSLATNHYIICMLQRISDDLGLQPMLYQLSLLTIFYDIMVEQKSCPCQEYANIVDFLTKLVRKMLKKMKNQPLLFVEVLFWKSRRECHYINAEYLLNELGHLKKESRNWDDTQGDAEVGSSPVKVWARRCIADALGEDEADVVITYNSGYQNDGEKLDDAEGAFASTSGIKIGRDDNDNEEQLIEDESGKASRRKKKLILDDEVEGQIKDLYEKFKDDRHCSRRIAEVLDPDGKISPAQISNKLKKLGLKVAPRKRTGGAEEPVSTSLNQFESKGTTKGVTNIHKSANLEGSSLGPHLQKRKRVQAFSEDQEALIRSLYEQFKDHKRCNYLIANALDVHGKFTPAQVSRKLKKLGLNVSDKSSSGGNKRQMDKDLNDSETDREDEADDETLISLIKRKKNKDGRKLSKELPEQTDAEKLSYDDLDDEILSSVIKKKIDNGRKSIEELHEQTDAEKLSNDDLDDEILSSVLKKSRRSIPKSTGEELESIQIQKKTMDNDSKNGGIKDISEIEKRAGHLNIQVRQAEDQQVDEELVDSEDEVAPSVFPDSAITKRKLRMVIDSDDDD